MSLEASVEFADNPEPRCPCVLLLDTSGSMGGAPIGALQEGIFAFKEALMQEELASKRVELAIVTFDIDAKVIQDFVTADNFAPPTFTALGAKTMMSTGINRAFDLVKARKTEYRENGIQYYRPWVFMITDGAPTESEQEVQNTSRRIHSAEAAKELMFFAVGVEGANMEVLRTLCPGREPLKLRGLEFKSMFVWLSSSMKRVSNSRTGEQVPLPPVGWNTAG
jgi:uncharacterized protein YegL